MSAGPFSRLHGSSSAYMPDARRDLRDATLSSVFWTLAARRQRELCKHYPAQLMPCFCTAVSPRTGNPTNTSHRQADSLPTIAYVSTPRLSGLDQLWTTTIPYFHITADKPILAVENAFGDEKLEPLRARARARAHANSQDPSLLTAFIFFPISILQDRMLPSRHGRPKCKKPPILDIFTSNFVTVENIGHFVFFSRAFRTISLNQIIFIGQFFFLKIVGPIFNGVHPRNKTLMKWFSIF